MFLLLNGTKFYVSKNIFYYFLSYIIVQTKYLALDFHEERKWKRAFASIYAKDAKMEIAERKKKKKIDDLYKTCYSIYFSITHGNNSSEFSEDSNNELNDYLKPKLNEYDNLEKELNNWKKQIKELENKLKSNIKLEGNYANFLDIFSLIQSIINNQEEKLKELKFKNKSNDIPNLPSYGSLSDFAVLLKNTNFITKENKNCAIIADKSNINYNTVNANISKIIQQVIEEFNKQALKIEETNIKNSFKENTNNTNNANNTNNLNNINNANNNKYNNINSTINNNSNNIINNNQNIQNEINNSILKAENDNINDSSNKTNPKSSIKSEDNLQDYEMQLNNGLNPSKLILKIEEEISQENLVKSLQSNLGIDNCFVLPLYDFDKLMNSTFDLNSMDFDYKNSYYNIFPMIEKDEKKISCKKTSRWLRAK